MYRIIYNLVFNKHRSITTINEGANGIAIVFMIINVK